MTSIITRRSLLGGLISAMAAPAIVRASSLMPVRALARDLVVYGRSPGMIELPELGALARMLRHVNEQFEKLSDAQLMVDGHVVFVRTSLGAFHGPVDIFKHERDVT